MKIELRGAYGVVIEIYVTDSKTSKQEAIKEAMKVLQREVIKNETHSSNGISH